MIALFAILNGTAIAKEPPEEDSNDGYWLTEYEGSRLQQEDLASIASGEYAYVPNDIALNGCRYDTGADNPHVSGNEASVPGWWVKKNNKCPSKAYVQAWLQAAWCSGWTCIWITLDSSDKELLWPGGGRGNSVNARYACHSNELTVYRNLVDVDIPGTFDTPFVKTMVEQIRFRPPGPGYY